MNATERRIFQQVSEEQLDVLVAQLATLGLPGRKLRRYIRAVRLRRAEIVEGGPILRSTVAPGLPPKDCSQEPRWRRITKCDGDGNLLLLGYERRSPLSRKAGQVRWLRTPRLLKAAETPTAAATIVA